MHERGEAGATGAAGDARRHFFLTDTPSMLAREHLGPEMESREDGLRQGTGKGNIEWWYFDAKFDDGSKAVVVFLTKPMIEGAGPLKPKLEITFTRPNGEEIRDWAICAPEDFRAGAERCDLAIGESSAVGDLETYELRIRGSKLRADLRFQRIVPSWRSGAGKVYFDGGLKDFLGWVVPVPHGSVEGTLFWPEGERRVAGSGYHDHNWANYPIEKAFDYWFWGRVHSGSLTALFFDALGAGRRKGERLGLFMLAKEDRIVVPEASDYAIEPSEIVADEVRHGRNFPRKLKVHARSGATEVEIGLSEPRIMERDDMLSGAAPSWLAAILRPFVNPWYYRFAARFEARVSVDGSAETARGEGVYEMMVFGKASELRPGE